MKTFAMRVNGTVYFLEPEQEIDVLQSAIIEASSSPGGRVVEFEARGRGRISLLVQPGTTVSFEPVNHVESSEGRNPAEYPVMDVDSYRGGSVADDDEPREPALS